ncbi:K+-transporting ATPase ATPase B chain [Luteibacter rhizovicinus]|uniref:Potassium-transporting ATPase ATP-binding subunit n=1 Tax=Luteibacter rhizovicinus TaxID=242606 RepID=A0A4R3YNN6_9GAMM|nr:potassium-transporting ATPase subunit KdpB [Luteibacter rhizovicinus]TCV93862.1 K+-transporting ATPase ATPase B chain [Luteibacter rhizovicinus]
MNSSVSQSAATRGTLDATALREAVIGSVAKLAPRAAARNPVMFTVSVGTVICAAFTVHAAFTAQPFGFSAAVTLILLLTVLFANFAEAVAEARGRGQAQSLRSTRAELSARRVRADGGEDIVPATQLRRGDRVRVSAGEAIPADGDVVEGVASINEAAVTGESAPVLREAGTDRSGVIGGTWVLSDVIVVEVATDPGDSFLDRMIALVEGASRQKTPNELALTVLLSALTIVFLAVVATLPGQAAFVGAKADVVLLIALLVCLIPTTIGGLLPAIGIAGMNRALKANIIAKSGKAVEVAGDIDVLLLDKTGTITHGDRRATVFVPVGDVRDVELRDAALLASLADPTPEGKSIVQLARERGSVIEGRGGEFVPFTAQTRMSGVDFPDGRVLRKGSSDAMHTWASARAMVIPGDLSTAVERIARAGGTPLVVADDRRLLGVIALSDVVKHGVRERFAQLRAMGVRTVMITGDNPLTAAAIAAEAGVDDFMAEARPEDKLQRIRDEQTGGRMVAMVGDGTNDAPALAQADIGLAMNSGTQAAREAGNMVDLDSDPTKLLAVVEIGKQLLITRGALTTFSLANDVAKYFAIIPAIFAGSIPALGALNLMHLASPTSAVLSALVFNALIIPALIPLALRGVRVRPMSAEALLRRNLLIYGAGGVVLPFIAIKAIDLLLSPLLGA